MKPFYSPARGEVIVDAKCECGHSEHDHGSVLKDSHGVKIKLKHDGGCCCAHCDCRQFRWAGWIGEKKKSDSKEMAACG